MSIEEQVNFSGPFSWPGTPDAPSVFEVEVAKQPGIYLWTVALGDSYLVYYVGETGRSHQARLLEHYKEHVSCMYRVYSPPEFARGEKVLLWPGYYDAGNRKTLSECIGAFGGLSGPIAELTQLYRFFLAPLSCEVRRRQRIEAALADALYAAPGLAGEFQDRGIHYDRRRDDEKPIECEISLPAVLICLPPRLSA